MARGQIVGGQTIEIAASDRVLERLERGLATGNRRLRKGAAAAIYRALRSGRAAASKEVRETINLKKNQVDRYIFISRVSEKRLQGGVYVVGARLPLHEFMTPKQIISALRRQKGRLAQRSKGVPVKVYKKKKAIMYLRAWVGAGRISGKLLVFRRLTKQPYPILLRRGPSLIEEFEKGIGRFAARANERLNIEIERVIARFAGAD